MKDWEARAKEIAEKSPYLSVVTTLKVRKGNRRPKDLPLSPMAKKALEQAVKRFDLEDYEADLIIIASAIARMENKVYVEGEDVNEATTLLRGIS